MDHPEAAVAVAHRLHDHAHRGEVVDLVELAAALVHLLPDRVEVLRPPADARLDADLGELAAEDRDDLVDLGLALEPTLGHPAHEGLIVVGIERAEGQVLQLRLHLRHAQPVGEGRVDVEGLLGDLLGLVPRQVVERPHVVEPVGELDHQDPQVAGHGHHHLAEGLGLPLLAGGEGELADLGDSVHQLGDLAPELALEIGLGGQGVLEHVVEETRRHRGDVHPEVDEEAGHLQGMGEIRLAGRALLALVGTLGVAVGALDHSQVRARLVFRNLVDQCRELGQPVPPLG